jgi:peptidylprolyl isomerase/peptidyl-prolyl cis-trans isomerase B (cyclophilin B)
MEKIMQVHTDFGDMYIWLFKETPLHRANYLNLAYTGYLDSTTFHRTVKDFVIQGGDPNSKDADSTNDGFGGPGYTIPAEFVSALKHDYGAVGAARDNNPQKASNGSQFYIVVDQNGEHTLDTRYTVFGKVISGMDVAVVISKQPQNSNNRPYTNIKMDVNLLEFSLDELKTKFNFTP